MISRVAIVSPDSEHQMIELKQLLKLFIHLIDVWCLPWVSKSYKLQSQCTDVTTSPLRAILKLRHQAFQPIPDFSTPPTLVSILCNHMSNTSFHFIALVLGRKDTFVSHLCQHLHLLRVRPKWKNKLSSHDTQSENIDLLANDDRTSCNVWRSVEDRTSIGRGER